jgi:hypothetical protein
LARLRHNAGLIRLLETTLPTQLQKRMSSIARWIADRIEAAADHYAAATIYEQLSRLSDAELQRRGIARETLQRDVSEAFRPALTGTLGSLDVDLTILRIPKAQFGERPIRAQEHGGRSGRYGPSPPAASVRGWR